MSDIRALNVDQAAWNRVSGRSMPTLASRTSRHELLLIRRQMMNFKFNAGAPAYAQGI
jgi:hypothetical protein